MFSAFYPHTTANNVFELDTEFFGAHGIEGVVFDIDNTLVTHDTKHIPDNVKEYINSLRRSGIQCMIISNNYRERVEAFLIGTDIPYMYRAWKPFKKNLRKVCGMFNLEPNKICLVGDQIFTDIYGGRRMKFYTVLVTAVGKSETGFVAFKRLFEKLVMNEYKKKKIRLDK